ncbi:MAG: hypothetical protein EHM20_14630 [Alphaproteobacteria bacterium]|nr:MAG: hypothetical protein EHM20_14630 [Alphaproteobacteria bacterium]
MKVEIKKSYRIVNTYRVWMIAPVVAWLCMLSMPFLLRMEMTGSVIDFIFVFVLVTLLGLILVIEAFTDKIVTSSSGIEIITLFRHRSLSWEDAILVENNPFGFVALIFSFPRGIPQRTFLTVRLQPAYIRILISPFIEDFHTSSLIKDIEMFAPDIKIMEAVKDKKSMKPYQKISLMGLYLLVCFIINLPIAVIARNLAILMEDNWIKGTGFILIMSSMGLLGAIIGGSFQLMEYSGILRSIGSEAEINRYVSSFYWSPVIGPLFVLLLGILIFAILYLLHYQVQDVNVAILNLLAFIVGFYASKLYRTFRKDEIGSTH